MPEAPNVPGTGPGPGPSSEQPEGPNDVAPPEREPAPGPVEPAPEQPIKPAPVEPAPQPVEPAPEQPVKPAPEEEPAFDPGDEMPEEDAPKAAPKTAPKTAPKPAPPAKAPEEDEDLFNEDEKPAKGASNEAPAVPADEPVADEPVPAAAPEKKADDVDDLFDEPAEKEPMKTATKPDDNAAEDSTEPKEELPVEEAAGKEESAAVPSPDEAVAAVEPSRDQLRVWTDNTGDYKVNARLVVILNGAVRLQKETGRFTTVPMNRLSPGDLKFVQEQAQATATAGVDR